METKKRKKAKRPPIKRREIRRILKEQGYKLPTLYLNENGKIYSITAGRELKPTKQNQIKEGNNYFYVPKLMLLTFKGEPIRGKQQIRYIDGNRNNLRLQNLAYIRQFTEAEKNSINDNQLLTAIRCYYEVQKRYNTKDRFKTRVYLHGIIKRRRFYDQYSDKAGIDVFQSYMQGCFNSLRQTAKENGINIKDCSIIINNFINLLINDILTDLQAGKLGKNPFIKRKTKTDLLKEANKYLIEIGCKPIPLRKKRAENDIIN